MLPTDSLNSDEQGGRSAATDQALKHAVRSLWLLFVAGTVVCIGLTYYLSQLVMVGRIRLSEPNAYSLNLLICAVCTWLVFRAAISTKRLRRASTDVNFGNAMRSQSRVWRFMAAVAMAYVIFTIGFVFWYTKVMQAFGP